MDNRKLKYQKHKGAAKARGIEFNLSFEEWCKIWDDSGKWKWRGKGWYRYSMCRYRDSGGYEVGNVYIGTGADNYSDHSQVIQDGQNKTRKVYNEVDKTKILHDWSHDHDKDILGWLNYKHNAKANRLPDLTFKQWEKVRPSLISPYSYLKNNYEWRKKLYTRKIIHQGKPATEYYFA